MSVVVQKYGGTSVADPERISAVADRVRDTRLEGHDVVVVVSAMGHATDELLELASRVSQNPPRRELDMLLTTGERVSMALLAMALDARGVAAVSYTGSQAGILTDSSHGEARITRITGERVRQSLEEGKVVIVAGFQGVDPESKEVTTLGRGGSDATAVALAAALGADHVEIYTDVDGVYTADPRLVPVARKVDELPFDEMLELSASGAGVLMSRSVEIGRRYDIPIHVRSSFHDRDGTWVRDSVMEQAIVSGVAHDRSEARVTVTEMPDRAGVAARLFEALAGSRIVVDMIVQNVARDGSSDLSFTVPKAHLAEARRITEQVAAEVGAGSVDVDDGIGKVSLVGAGMKSQPGVAAKMFSTLAAAGINIEMISTSTIRISCVVRADDVDKAVSVLHGSFDLTDAGGEE